MSIPGDTDTVEMAAQPIVGSDQLPLRTSAVAVDMAGLTDRGKRRPNNEDHSVEVGYRIGKSRHARSPDEKDAPVAAMVGSILDLLAFMLAFMFSMAACSRMNGICCGRGVNELAADTQR